MRTAEGVVESLRHGTQLDHLATALNVLGAVQLDARQPGRALASHQDALTFASRVEYRLELARAARASAAPTCTPAPRRGAVLSGAGRRALPGHGGRAHPGAGRRPRGPAAFSELNP
ncbi:hypothetical protein ACFQV2_18090 [Actinokineospora soli]|uniref:Tetratricopeptide repeat-containing protein n=1 Tax=Actinokineospora soli TaxID=1048753 RepID=A0ABW2TMX3_9PSEU